MTKTNDAPTNKAQSTATRGSTHTVFTFPLRANEWLKIRLPSDITAAEMDRVAAWIKLIPIPQQSSLPL